MTLEITPLAEVTLCNSRTFILLTKTVRIRSKNAKTELTDKVKYPSAAVF